MGRNMGISVWQLLIILAIVLVLFGAKRMRGLGSDLGSAIKGFKQALRDDSGTGEETSAASHEAVTRDTADAPR